LDELKLIKKEAKGATGVGLDTQIRSVHASEQRVAIYGASIRSSPLMSMMPTSLAFSNNVRTKKLQMAPYATINTSEIAEKSKWELLDLLESV
jgi:hypothetical protein